MDSVQDIFASVMVIVTAICTIVARFKETSSELSLFARAVLTFDLSQILDSTRSLSDVPVDMDDGEDFDAEVSDD